MEKVTIGEDLMLVSRTYGEARDIVLSYLMPKIEKNKEEKILKELLIKAKNGGNQVFLGKTLPPEELKDEGIWFKFSKSGNVIAGFGPC